ncbi:Ig-like domain-containing protein [Mangrovihabitans endophyticus]|uniref:NodB homology domain-containing protein n=1 Tax=Mangrovihabitans endophyticus TaxID=1751298 RepID=A0A8J3C7V5_9ACTN|nr:Ig-like domain-containing protein [Mangrovihabitans endophyticus]GGL17172.1 hypothetical protein GCM10012284_59700 [Mangrovihabitans endophyticus]
MKPLLHLPFGRRTLLAVSALLLLGAASIVPSWRGEAAAEEEVVAERSPVTVSLTYDDGTADQLAAAQIMERHGMRGTFYINSSRLGASGRLDLAEVEALQDQGHEIGGHTVTHADLPTLSPNEQARQICDDRVSLLNKGLRVTNFAYPYGDENAAVQQVVADCGYNSGRVVGGVISAGSCADCPPSEQMPPGNPYAVRTPDSVKPTTNLEDMENWVLQAEQEGGGWVVIVMHRVCDDCDPYAVTPQKLENFLTWLEPRAADGTVVRTIDQVIGGTVQPGVDGPAPASRGEMSELLRNTSMETDLNTDGVPDCWQRGGYGENTWYWTDQPEAHTGGGAMEVVVSTLGRGDRRILSPQDLGACAPRAVVGHTYDVTAWYQASGSVRMVAYYRNPNSRWVYLSQSPPLAETTEWREATWTTPAMPAGASALSVGLSLRSDGLVAGDDFSVMDSDQVDPQAALTSPVDGSRVRGTTTFTAEASDASGVGRVEFVVDGEIACTDTAAPYTCDYDSEAKPDSVIAVTARAVDTAGNIGLSEGRTFTVSNSVPLDQSAPTVALTAPVDGATVSQMVTLSAEASDNDAVSRVLFYVGDDLIGAAKSAPYTLEWDSSTLPDGAVGVQAKALDLSGNLGASTVHTVTVSNYSLDTTPPTTTATCDGQACAGGWHNRPVKIALSSADAESGVDKTVYTLDGTAPTQAHGTVYTAPFDVEGTATVTFRAWDHADNLEETHQFTQQVDLVPPTARLSEPEPEAHVTNPVYLRADVDDANGISRVYFFVDDTYLGSRTITPYRWKWDTSGFEAGSHTVRIVTEDVAGNRTSSASVPIVTG